MTNIPMLLVGPPGIGKTAKIKVQYDHVEVLLLSSSTEEDISGMPFLRNGEEARTVPAFIRRLQKADEEGNSTCLFLDELDKSRREVADTLLSLVVDPKSFGIPENTVLRAAANPPEWGGGDGISDAMLSRWCVVNETMDKKAVQEQVEFWQARYAECPKVESALTEILSVAETYGMIEASGEGLLRRITCPRTITMVLDYLKDNDSGVDKVAAGLLTPSFTSVFSKSNRIRTARSAAKVALQHEPIRVKI